MSDYVLVEGEEMITVFLCNEESKSIFFQIFFFPIDVLPKDGFNQFFKQAKLLQVYWYPVISFEPLMTQLSVMKITSTH